MSNSTANSPTSPEVLLENYLAACVAFRDAKDDPSDPWLGRPCDAWSAAQGALVGVIVANSPPPATTPDLCSEEDSFARHYAIIGNFLCIWQGEGEVVSPRLTIVDLSRAERVKRVV